MIDACRTAAESAKMTQDALEETRKGQRTSRRTAIAAGVSALAAVAAVIANIAMAFLTAPGGGAPSVTFSRAPVIGVGIAITVINAFLVGLGVVVARRSLRHHALTELMRDYSQDPIGEGVDRLWRFWRACDSNVAKVIEEFEASRLKRRDGKERLKYPHLNADRRHVSHFYQRMAGLYLMHVLPGRILYRHWSKETLEIIPKVIIPLEEVLIRNRGEEVGHKLDPLKILNKDSEAIGRWGRMKRRIGMSLLGM